MSVKAAKRAVNLGLLEEDDIFEEFPTKGKNQIFSRYGDLTDFFALEILSLNRKFNGFFHIFRSG